MSHLEIDILKRIVSRLESQAGVSREDQELREMRDLLMALELSRRFDESPQPPLSKGGFLANVEWGKLLPLLLALGVVLAVIVAEILGVDVKKVVKP